MINITNKITTHRSAIAQATVSVSRQETIDAVLEKRVPKGDVLESSRVAGLFAVKRTSDMIPDCHPIPVEYCKVSHEISGLEILIRVEVQTVYRTGVEVEAMHGASVSALTIYDMLKPIDKEIVISNIRLLEKTGGKSGYSEGPERIIAAGVIVCSDRVSAGTYEDTAGKVIVSKLAAHGIDVNKYSVIPDSITLIQEKIRSYIADKTELVILTGGTGLSSRDVTPDAIRPMLDREIPGIAEAVRSYGQERMPYSMLSGSIAGLIGRTIILALPGSARGAEESMDALFPYLLHAFSMLEDSSHKL